MVPLLPNPSTAGVSRRLDGITSLKLGSRAEGSFQSMMIITMNMFLSAGVHYAPPQAAGSHIAPQPRHSRLGLA
jgi:hypothetical protein